MKPGESESYLDLAIADVSQHWATLSKECGNRPIEIDRENWHEPRWAHAKLLAAAGWPEMGKRNVTANGKPRVRGSITLIIADVSGGISRHEDIILMNSRLDAPHGWYFSGVSGGPIYVIQGDLIIPAGLLYEGWPQAKDERQGELTPNDILIRGVTLTPSNFEKWLSSARLT